MARDLFQEAGISVAGTGRDLFAEAGISPPEKEPAGVIDTIKSGISSAIDDVSGGIERRRKKEQEAEYARSNAASQEMVRNQQRSGNAQELQAFAQSDAAQAKAREDIPGAAIDLARDTGVNLARGVADIGQAATGLTAMPLDAVGALDPLKKVGVDFREASKGFDQFDKWAAGYLSDTGKGKEAKLEASKGFTETLLTLGADPRMMFQEISKSLPGTFAAGKVGEAAVGVYGTRFAAEAKAAGLTGEAAQQFIANKFAENSAKITSAAMIGSAAGEGTQQTGGLAGKAQAANIPFKDYAGPAVASGVLDAAISLGSNKVANKIGIGDIESDIALRRTGINTGKTSPAFFANRAFIEGLKEGAFEEMPQSTQEAIMENIAFGRPWSEGIGKAAAQGLATGFGMGVGHAAVSRDSGSQPDAAVPPGVPPSATPAADILGMPGAPVSEAKQTEAEKALFAPKSLTALDRVDEIDRRLASPDAGVEETFNLQTERDNITKSWPAAIHGADTSFTTEAGARIDAQYSLIDASELTTSHDENLRAAPNYPQELQPRQRDRAASEMQVSSIVQKLDPARLGLSADAATGAPIVGADGLVESGNARTIALKRIYQANGQKAADYKQFLKDNAAQFGIMPESVDAMQKPVLVRVRNTPVNRAEFARQANASTVAQMSQEEQAKSDASRIDDMSDLTPDENGDFTSSRDFIRRFIAKLPGTEQGNMIDASGKLSPAGYARIRNAVLAKAYGESPVLERMLGSMDDSQRNIGKALMRVAPDIAKMRQDIGDGALFDADITPDLLAAVEELAKIKESGQSVAEAITQAGIFGDAYTPETGELLQFLADNLRRPRVIAEFVQNYMAALTAAGNPNQGSIFGDAVAPTKGELLKAAKGNEDAGNGTGATGASEDTIGRNAQGNEAAGAQAEDKQKNASISQGGAQGNEASGSADEWMTAPAAAPKDFDVTHAATAALDAPENSSIRAAWTSAHRRDDGSRVNHDFFEQWHDGGGVTSEVGSQYDAHGIAKGNPLGALLNILSNGINRSRRFDTAPLIQSAGNEAGAGAGLGTAGGAYKDGPFILLGARGKELTNGIHTVLVADGVANVIPQLQAKYPAIRFVKFSEAQSTLSSDQAVSEKSSNQEPVKNQSEQPLDMVPAADAVLQPKTDATPEAKQDNAPVSTLQPDPALQNLDRGRAASVNQMQSIARNPDYMRLGPSRTPDSGAPMVFAVGNDTQKISPANFGANDTAVMSDGQRVPFRYAVVDASSVEPSNFADGATNPAFASNAPGTIKALNNGRTAGVRSAHSSGNAATYTAELLADNAHGVSPEAIRNTPNPMLVRVYAEQSNTGAITPMFSRGNGAAGMGLRDLQAVVDRISRGFKNLPKVHVLASPSELSKKDPVQKSLRNFIRKAGAWEDAEGATHDGEIYLFASGLADEARAEHVLATHEVTHYGLRGAIGKGLDSELQNIWMLNAKVRKAAAALKERYGLKSNIEATEEVLADMRPQDLVKLMGWRRVVKSIRDWLGRSGFNKLAAQFDSWLKSGLDDAQKADLMVADLVNAARDWVKNGKGRPFMDGTRLADGSLAEDVAAQEKWLTREAKARGYKSIDDLAEKNYKAFENLAKLWRDKHPVEGALLSRNSSSQTANQSTAAQRADEILSKPVVQWRPVETVVRTLTQTVRLDRLTTAVYDKAGALLNRYTPEQIKAGMVADYGIPEAVLDQRVVMQGRQKVQMRKAGDLIERLATLTRAESRVAYEWMNNSDPQTLAYFESQLPEDSLKTMEEVKGMIDRLSKEAVDLGQLDPEAYKRNRFEYLRRSYIKHTTELTKGETSSRQRAISILGDQYKGRGMTDAVDMAKFKNIAPEWWGRKLQEGKADKGLKGEKFIRLERRANLGDGVDVLAGMEATGQRGKLLEVVYWPSEVAIPAKLSTWDQAGTWEVRDTKGGKLIVWRDFTKQERTNMGEIDEARYAIAKTLHGMVHDVETGRYLEWLSQRYAKKEGEPIDGEVIEASERMRDVFKPGEWVRVPETKIQGTQVLKYGKLAGRYLPGPIWNDVRQTVGFRFKPLGETYSAILSAWKISKTALSPAVHTNNVMANFVMADWHDVSAGHILKALRILLASGERDGKGIIGRTGNAAMRAGIADREAAKLIMDRYQDSGGNIGTWATSELQKEQLEPLLKALEAELGTVGESTGAQVGVMVALNKLVHGRFAEMVDALKLSKPSQLIGNEASNLISLYETEDQVFRLAAWLKAKEDGAGDLAAGKVARKSFLDYNINAPWVQAMRSTALPFMAFTYRAAPMMLDIAAHKPWKLIKLGMLAGALNALGYMLAGGDEDDERKLLPKEKAGSIFGMVPKLIRMPWNDAHGAPVFLDIRRFVPVGDIFDTGATHSAFPLLPFVVPGGPLALLSELMANKSQFTGKAITLETDTAIEKASKVADHLYKAFAPNIAILPGTYAWTGIRNAAKGRTDSFGQEQSTPMAISSAFGVKLGSYPKDVLQLNAQRAMQAKLMEIDHNIQQLKRERQRNGIDSDEFASKVAVQNEKKAKLMEDFQKKMSGGK